MVAFVLVILLACYYTSAKTTIPVAQLTTSFSSLPLIQYTAETVTTSPYAYISQSLSAGDTLCLHSPREVILLLDHINPHPHSYPNPNPLTLSFFSDSGYCYYECSQGNLHHLDLFVEFQVRTPTHTLIFIDGHTLSFLLTDTRPLIFINAYNFTSSQLYEIIFSPVAIANSVISCIHSSAHFPICLFICRSFTRPFILPFTHPISLQFPYRYTSFSIYLTGLFGWCGFWIFSFFCGAGLTSLPFDMIMVFVYRPMKMDPEELQRREIELQGRDREGGL